MPLVLLKDVIRGFDADDKANFEWKPHPESESLYLAACAELRASKIASQILDYLMGQNRIIDVLVTDMAKPNFYPNEELNRH